MLFCLCLFVSVILNEKLNATINDTEIGHRGSIAPSPGVIYEPTLSPSALKTQERANVETPPPWISQQENLRGSSPPPESRLDQESSFEHTSPDVIPEPVISLSGAPSSLEKTIRSGERFDQESPFEHMSPDVIPEPMISPSQVKKRVSKGEIPVVIRSDSPPPTWTDPFSGEKKPYTGQKDLNKNEYPFVSTQLNAYHKKAQETQKRLPNTLQSIANVFPGAYLEVPSEPKSLESAQRKLVEVVGLDARKITDLARGSIIFHSMADLKKGLALLREKYQILREVDRFQNPWEDGYRDVQLLTQDPENGILIEVQLHLKDLKDFTNKTAHKIYEQVREIKGNASRENRPLSGKEQSAIDALNAQSRAGYEEALRKAG